MWSYFSLISGAFQLQRPDVTPFEAHIVCDGLIIGRNSFGGESLVAVGEGHGLGVQEVDFVWFAASFDSSHKDNITGFRPVLFGKVVRSIGNSARDTISRARHVGNRGGVVEGNRRVPEGEVDLSKDSRLPLESTMRVGTFGGASPPKLDTSVQLQGLEGALVDAWRNDRHEVDDSSTRLLTAGVVTAIETSLSSIECSDSETVGESRKGQSCQISW